MKYYLEIIEYNGNDCLTLKKILIDGISLDELLSLVDEDIISVEYYKKREIGKDKAISSLIYKGIEKREDGDLLFVTNHDDSFSISDLDVNISDLKTLVDGVRECNGIYAYFDIGISKKVTVKYLVPSKEKEYDVCEEIGILRKVDSFGNILLNDKYIDFNSILSIKSPEITYVNPFVGPSVIDYYNFFTMLEGSAFGKNRPYGLRKEK